MTTDTFPKVATAHGDDRRRRRSRINGIAKGAGMIAPDMATMLSFVFTDAPIARRGAAGPAVDAASTSSLQRHHGRQRHLDLRHAAALRHRRGREARRPRIARRGRPPARGRSARRSTTCCSISPTRSRATARARATSSSVDVEGAAERDLGQAHRHVDRQLAAGEDRDRRRGRQLGPRRDGGRQGRRAGRPRPAGDLRSATSASPSNGARDPDYDEATIVRLHEGRGDRHPRRSSASATARRTVWTCDLTKEYVEINGDYRS